MTLKAFFVLAVTVAVLGVVFGYPASEDWERTSFATNDQEVFRNKRQWNEPFYTGQAGQVGQGYGHQHYMFSGNRVPYPKTYVPNEPIVPRY